MDLEMVLNELSLHPLAKDIHDARQRMSTLIQVIAFATRSKVKRVLRTHNDLSFVELAPDYPIAKWLNDDSVDRDSQRFFKSLTTKYPFLVDIAEKNVAENFDLSDYFWQEKRAIGLGVAFLLDGLALSLSSDSSWLSDRLRLRIAQLDDDGEIADAVEEIPHASLVEHIISHLPWIRERLRANIQFDVHEGSDIWAHREEWFPHLYFCEQVRAQLYQLRRNHLMLKPVLGRLYELEDYCNNWLDGAFDHTKIKCKATPESTATLEMYGSERTFRCHDSLSRVFSWHIRLTPNAWRLYFYPLPEEHRLIIGYVGSHLNTKHY